MRGNIARGAIVFLGQHVLNVVESSFFTDVRPRERLRAWANSFTLTTEGETLEILIFLPQGKRLLKRENYARVRIEGLIRLLVGCTPRVRFSYLDDEELAALVV